MNKEQKIINAVDQQLSNSAEGIGKMAPLERELEQDANVEMEETNDDQQENLSEIIVEDEEDPFRNVQIGLDGKYKQLLIDFWQNIIDDMQSLNDNILILQNEQFLNKFNNIASNEEEDMEMEEVYEEPLESYDLPENYDPTQEFEVPGGAEDNGGHKESASGEAAAQDHNLQSPAKAGHSSLMQNNEADESQQEKEDLMRNDTTFKHSEDHNNMESIDEEEYKEKISTHNTGKGSTNYELYQSLTSILKQEEASLKQLSDIVFNNKDEENDPYRQNKLPLARIKKLMKFDDNLKMISSETPVIFSKLCEVFIQELTLRSWSIVDSDKRRTVQKQDILNALVKSDMYDFLIDIVPRE